jgi:hypothetical protein
MMEEGLDDIPQNPNAKTIDALYAQATEHLKTRDGFVFQNTRLNPQNWTSISTWAKNVKRSMIVSKGIAQDKANLPNFVGLPTLTNNHWQSNWLLHRRSCLSAPTQAAIMGTNLLL